MHYRPSNKLETKKAAEVIYSHGEQATAWVTLGITELFIDSLQTLLSCIVPDHSRL